MPKLQAPTSIQCNVCSKHKTAVGSNAHIIYVANWPTLVQVCYVCRLKLGKLVPPGKKQAWQRYYKGQARLKHYLAARARGYK